MTIYSNRYHYAILPIWVAMLLCIYARMYANGKLYSLQECNYIRANYQIPSCINPFKRTGIPEEHQAGLNIGAAAFRAADTM